MIGHTIGLAASAWRPRLNNLGNDRVDLLVYAEDDTAREDEAAQTRHSTLPQLENALFSDDAVRAVHSVPVFLLGLDRLHPRLDDTGVSQAFYFDPYISVLSSTLPSLCSPPPVAVAS